MALEQTQVSAWANGGAAGSGINGGRGGDGTAKSIASAVTVENADNVHANEIIVGGLYTSAGGAYGLAGDGGDGVGLPNPEITENDVADIAVLAQPTSGTGNGGDGGDGMSELTQTAFFGRGLTDLNVSNVTAASLENNGGSRADGGNGGHSTVLGGAAQFAADGQAFEINRGGDGGSGQSRVTVAGVSVDQASHVSIAHVEGSVIADLGAAFGSGGRGGDSTSGDGGNGGDMTAASLASVVAARSSNNVTIEDTVASAPTFPAPNFGLFAGAAPSAGDGGDAGPNGTGGDGGHAHGDARAFVVAIEDSNQVGVESVTGQNVFADGRSEGGNGGGGFIGGNGGGSILDPAQDEPVFGRSLSGLVGVSGASTNVSVQTLEGFDDQFFFASHTVNGGSAGSGTNMPNDGAVGEASAIAKSFGVHGFDDLAIGEATVDDNAVNTTVWVATPTATNGDGTPGTTNDEPRIGEEDLP